MPSPTEYIGFVRHGAYDRDNTRIFAGGPRSYLLAALGLAGEAGEVVDIIKKWQFHPGKELDHEHLEEEIGDFLWYAALLIEAEGLSFERIMGHNMRKLVARYPDRYADLYLRP